MILVARPDKGAVAAAARTSEELHALGLSNQRLVINGVFHASARNDAVATAIKNLAQQALDELPDSLRALPQDRVPLRAFDTVGLPALRALLCTQVHRTEPGKMAGVERADHLPGLDALADELARPFAGCAACR